MGLAKTRSEDKKSEVKRIYAKSIRAQKRESPPRPHRPLRRTRGPPPHKTNRPRPGGRRFKKAERRGPGEADEGKRREVLVLWEKISARGVAKEGEKGLP